MTTDDIDIYRKPAKKIPLQPILAIKKRKRELLF